MGCHEDNIRIIRIYSSNRGILRVHNRNEDHRVDVPHTPWKKAPWGRPNAYDKATKYQNGGMGYTFLVKAGYAYMLHVGSTSDMPDLFTPEEISFGNQIVFTDSCCLRHCFFGYGSGTFEAQPYIIA